MGGAAIALLEVAKNWWVPFSLKLVAQHCYVTGFTLTPIPPLLRHHPRGELCRSVKPFTDSVAKGMAIVQPGVVEEEGGGNGGGGNGGSVVRWFFDDFHRF